MKENLPFHPNGMIFKAIFNDGSVLEQDYYSIGGGFVATQDDNSADELCTRTLYPCHSGADVLKYCSRLNLSLSDLTYINEESWRSREEIRSEEHTSELQSRGHLVCRLL